MAGQIINFGTMPWGVSNDVPYQPDPGILIDPSLVSGGGTAYFRHYHQLGSGNAQFYTDSSATGGSPIGAGPDLTPAWEIADEAITFTEEGGSSLILKGPNHPDNTFSDPSESYFWTPDNRSAHASWVTNVGDGAVSMILWDGEGTKPGTTPPIPPLALSDFDQTGLEIVLLANIEAGLEISGDNRTYYADSNFTPAAGSLLDGELGLSATETLVSRFQYIFQGSNIGQIRLNDNDDPVALSLEDYFTGDGADLTLYVQTADDLVSVPVAGNIASDGSGFIRISIPTADGRAILNAIEDGTRFIFALARSAFNAHAVNAGDVAWTFAVPQPAVTHTRAHAVDAGNIAFSFAVPQPTVTHTSIQPQSHAVDAGDVFWSFSVPQLSVTHTPALPNAYTVDAGNIVFSFNLPQPTIRYRAAFVPQINIPLVKPVDPDDTLNLLIRQYYGAVKLRALITGILNVMETELTAPMMSIERAFNPDESSGILLDWIGKRLGLPRPSVASANAEYFGFKGTVTAAGKTFDQAPFFTHRAGIEQVEPVGNVIYRKLLKARARRLRGGTDRITIEAVLNILFGNGYAVESLYNVVLHVTAPDDALFLLVSTTLLDKVIPKPSGIAYSFLRT